MAPTTKEMTSWGKCLDERTVTKRSDDEDEAGKHCAIPFLINDKYYETCTRENPDPAQTSLKNFYWCPNIDLVTPNTPFAAPWVLSECSTHLHPEDNGCADHYEPVRVLFSVEYGRVQSVRLSRLETSASGCLPTS